jgi:hypothetical protein
LSPTHVLYIIELLKLDYALTPKVRLMQTGDSRTNIKKPAVKRKTRKTLTAAQRKARRNALRKQLRAWRKESYASYHPQIA